MNKDTYKHIDDFIKWLNPLWRDSLKSSVVTQREFDRYAYEATLSMRIERIKLERTRNRKKVIRSYDSWAEHN